MNQVTREQCEALKRVSGDGAGRVFLEWIRESRKAYLEKAFIAGARSEDKLANLEKAAVLTSLLEAVDEAPEMMTGWPLEDGADGL